MSTPDPAAQAAPTSTSAATPAAISPLDADAVSAAVDAALAAVAGADSLDALRAVRTAVTGDRSPIALANREIGGLQGPDKATAGKILGPARGRVSQALSARQVELEAERDARVLVEEAVDVTLPVDRRLEGARHPLELIQERVADFFVSMGWEIAEGPEVEHEWFNFDALGFDPDLRSTCCRRCSSVCTAGGRSGESSIENPSDRSVVSGRKVAST